MIRQVLFVACPLAMTRASLVWETMETVSLVWKYGIPGWEMSSCRIHRKSLMGVPASSTTFTVKAARTAGLARSAAATVAFHAVRFRTHPQLRRLLHSLMIVLPSSVIPFAVTRKPIQFRFSGSCAPLPAGHRLATPRRKRHHLCKCRMSAVSADTRLANGENLRQFMFSFPSVDRHAKTKLQREQSLCAIFVTCSP